ncbi:MAG TPA: pitrilysin family protein, partial [Bacteroidota bacterium]|nr:pitrilysin family protein [Bacteroidota bacterium]
MNRVKSVLAFVLILALGSLSAISQPNRSGPPKLGPPPALKLADIQHFKLSNNLPVVLMEKHGVPVFQINLLVRTGSVNDPQGKSGLANLTASMMEEGAGSRTSLELADAIDFLGASISAFSGMHTTHVSARAPVSKLDSTLALFRDVALRPTFPSEELERARKDRLTDLAQAHSEPSAIASAMLSKTLYGNDHPYGHTATGDEQSLRSFTVGDLQDYYKTYFHPNNATLIVVGDVDPKTIIAKLNDLFGNWKDGDIPTHTYSDVPQVKQRQIFLVDKP